MACALESAFRSIARERMDGLDVHNTRLSVEALEPELWAGRWLTVLITPWCLNLVLLPTLTGEWTSGRGHERLFYKFPAGDFAFLCGAEAGVGEYQSCALLSTMGDFVDQDSARATARAAREALLRAPAAMQAAPPDKAPLSRRGFLSGGLVKG